MSSADTTTLQAMLAVLQRIPKRVGSTMPSHDVQRRALAVLNKPADQRGITRHVERAIVYEVQGKAPAPYLVTLFVQPLYEVEQVGGAAGAARAVQAGEDVVDVKCSCPANVTCWHILVALTSAERDGLHLKV